MLTVRAVDAARNSIGQIHDITEMHVVERATQAGVLQMRTPNNQMSNLLRDTPGSGLELLDGGHRSEWIIDSYKDHYEGRKSYIEFTAVSLLAVLNWRDLRPEPGTVAAASMFTTSAHHTVTGTYPEVISSLVDAHIGQAAPVERRLLTVTPAAASGSSLTVSTRFKQQLGELVSELSITGQINPTVSVDDAGVWRFAASPAPLRNRPIGPDAGTLGSFTIGWTARPFTRLIVGGQGELLARTFAEIEAAAVPNDRLPFRREGYIEHTEAANSTDLAAAGRRDLEEQSAEYSFTADVTTHQSDQYNVGDLVPVRIDGYSDNTLRVTQVETIREPDAPDKRVLTFGTPGLDELAAAYGLAARTDRRTRLKEGN